ncbi:sulfite exporter TauE/SafE family protein [soil metagenome]
MTVTEYVVALLAVGVGALAQGAVGFGFGMLAAPVLALIDERLIPGSVLVLGLTVASFVAWQERGDLDWHGIRWALVGRVLGTGAGVYVVTVLDHDQLAVMLGVFILVAIAMSVAGWHVSPTPSTLVGAGAMSGVMGTLTSVGGPPMALVYQREEAGKLRSTLAGFFLFGASLALVTLAVSGELGRRQFVDGVLLLPGLVVGLLMARWLAPVLDRGWTRPAVLVMSTAAALALVFDAVIG